MKIYKRLSVIDIYLFIPQTVINRSVKVLHFSVFYEVRSNKIRSNSHIFKVIQKGMAHIKETE